MAQNRDGNALLISGGGVSGIAAATAAIMSGYTNVVVVEKRDSPSRPQKVLLSESVISAIHMLSECHFVPGMSNTNLERQFEANKLTNNLFFKLRQSKQIISIQDFQIYQAEFLKIINIHGYCTILQHSEILSFTTADHQNKACIKNSVTGTEIDVVFDSLIVADGSNSHTLSLLADFVPYRKALQQNTHNAYGFSKFKPPVDFQPSCVKFITSTVSNQTTARVIYQHVKEQEKSWTEQFMPLIYIQIDHETLEVYITGEVPESILLMNDTTQKIEVSGWFARILSSLYSYEFTIADMLQSAVFSHVPTILEKMCFSILNHANCFVIGDALLPANFLFGHGINKGLYDAYAVIEYLNSGRDNLTARLLQNIVDYEMFYEALELRRGVMGSCGKKEDVSTTKKSLKVLDGNEDFKRSYDFLEGLSKKFTMNCEVSSCTIGVCALEWYKKFESSENSEVELVGRHESDVI